MVGIGRLLSGTHAPPPPSTSLQAGIIRGTCLGSTPGTTPAPPLPARVGLVPPPRFFAAQGVVIRRW
jgi:hypothetical protein